MPRSEPPASDVSGTHDAAVRDLILVVGLVLATIGYVQTSEQTLTNRTLEHQPERKDCRVGFYVAQWIRSGSCQPAKRVASALDEPLGLPQASGGFVFNW